MIPDELKPYDFRSNLICDANNPILIQKAWRDRFSDPSHWDAGYGGTAYLSRIDSEDALVWNVFRSLQSAGPSGLAVIAEFFNLSPIAHLLFWGADVHDNSELQQLLNILIRTIDGRYRGTMTEPDLVVISQNEVVFCECKLKRTGTRSPFAVQRKAKKQTDVEKKMDAEEPKGAEKRMAVYIKYWPEITAIQDWQNVYQLIRQYVYAKKLALALNKTPRVVPLVNQIHCEILKKYYSPLRNSSSEMAAVFQPMLTWQGIKSNLSKSTLPLAAEIIRKMEKALDTAK